MSRFRVGDEVIVSDQASGIGVVTTLPNRRGNMYVIRNGYETKVHESQLTFVSRKSFFRGDVIQVVHPILVPGSVEGQFFDVVEDSAFGRVTAMDRFGDGGHFMVRAFKFYSSPEHPAPAPGISKGDSVVVKFDDATTVSGIVGSVGSRDFVVGTQAGIIIPNNWYPSKVEIVYQAEAPRVWAVGDTLEKKDYLDENIPVGTILVDGKFVYVREATHWNCLTNGIKYAVSPDSTERYLVFSRTIAFIPPAPGEK